MKKCLYYLCIGCLLFFFILMDVVAKDYQVDELIPIDEYASVETEHFMYNDMFYSNDYISFSSIQNLTDGKMPISFSLGLFDYEEKNIGIVNYCSEQDYNTNFANTSLTSNQSIAFSLRISDKYLVSGKDLSDVRYVVILSDNEYCKIGGVDNYAGMTISQIQGVEAGSYQGIGNILDNSKVFLVVLLVVLLFFCLVYSILLSMLYMRMYRKKTILAWIPICNQYLCVKLSFGKIVANIYMLLYFIGVLLNISMNINIIPILSIVSIISFVIVIIKLITKKYDLFIIENSRSFVTSRTKFINTNSSHVQRDESSVGYRDKIIDIDLSRSSNIDQSSSNSDNSSISMGGFADRNTILNGSFNSSLSSNISGEEKSDLERDSSDDLSQFYK